tara:strand:+ start:41 stop:601 length:561 start_codon:yes stop_codon:yes gene_type:complete
MSATNKVSIILTKQQTDLIIQNAVNEERKRCARILSSKTNTDYNTYLEYLSTSPNSKKTKSPSPSGWIDGGIINVNQEPSRTGTLKYKRYLLYKQNIGKSIETILGDTVLCTTKTGKDMSNKITKNDIKKDISDELLILTEQNTSQKKNKKTSKKAKKETSEEEEKQKNLDKLLDDCENDFQSEED